MPSNTEKRMKIAHAHYKAREKAGRSQEYMAYEVGVSKKTVQNWERGVSIPDLLESREWFRTLGLNPIPYYIELLSPYAISELDNDEKIDEEFKYICDGLPTDTKRALLHIFQGRHGSEPFAVIQLLLAYLHLPLRFRVTAAATIADFYEMCKELDEIINIDDILPKTDVLQDSIRRARVAVMHKEYDYTVFDKEAADLVIDALEVIPVEDDNTEQV